MRLVIAGGGTGGHLFPGIAIAEEVKRRVAGAEITFIGTERGIEATIVPREGYPIHFLRAEGIVGKSLLKKLAGVAAAAGAVMDARTVLQLLRPDAVVGVGGYASFGPVLAGRLMSIPTLIAEQNSVPGLANRLLGKISDAVCVTYHESAPFFPRAKTFITGNPVRAGIVSGNKEVAYDLFGLERGRFTIFVFGGSLGARTINHAICGLFPDIHDMKDRIQFLHQTGRTEYETVRETYRKWGFRGTVTPFVHEMADAYAVADVVVARAGASTLAELTAVGRAAILIPYPFAAAHHQEFNARRLAEMGAARVIADHDLTPQALAKDLRELLEQSEVRLDMQRASRSLGKPDAAQKIVDILESLIKNASSPGTAVVLKGGRGQKSPGGGRRPREEKSLV